MQSYKTIFEILFGRSELKINAQTIARKSLVHGAAEGNQYLLLTYDLNFRLLRSAANGSGSVATVSHKNSVLEERFYQLQSSRQRRAVSTRLCRPWVELLSRNRRAPRRTLPPAQAAHLNQQMHEIEFTESLARLLNLTLEMACRPCQTITSPWRKCKLVQLLQ